MITFGRSVGGKQVSGRLMLCLWKKCAQQCDARSQRDMQSETGIIKPQISKVELKIGIEINGA